MDQFSVSVSSNVFGLFYFVKFWAVNWVCCRPTRVEQFTTTPATRHELCAFQASTENISIWELVNHGALW